MNRDRSGCRLVLAAFACGRPPPVERRPRRPRCAAARHLARLFPLVSRPSAFRPRRQNVSTRLKSMGNTLSYHSEDPANEGPGINLLMLKRMFLPPPDESQHARSAASTRMNISDEPSVLDIARSPVRQLRMCCKKVFDAVLHLSIVPQGSAHGSS